MTPKTKSALARRLVTASRQLVAEPEPRVGYAGWFDYFCEATLASFKEVSNEIRYNVANIATSDLMCSFRLNLSTPTGTYAGIAHEFRIVPGNGRFPLVVLNAEGRRIAVSSSDMMPEAFARRIVSGLQT